MGRPNGQPNPKLSLRVVRDELERKLGTKVKFASDCVSEEAITTGKELNNGEILLLENLRFYAEEETKVKNKSTGTKEKVDPESVKAFCHKLSQFGDFYVNDAFGTCHRAHSSIVGTSHSKKAAGFLLEKEIKVLKYFFL